MTIVGGTVGIHLRIALLDQRKPVDTHPYPSEQPCADSQGNRMCVSHLHREGAHDPKEERKGQDHLKGRVVWREVEDMPGLTYGVDEQGKEPTTDEGDGQANDDMIGRQLCFKPVHQRWLLR